MKIQRQTLGSIQTTSLLSPRQVQRAVKKVLSAEKVRPTGDVHVIFTDGRHIRKINKTYLRHDRLTDVIAFPYDPVPGVRGAPPFGDVYICVSEARANARNFNVSFQEELTRLVVHGVLHILGYDDHDPKKKKKMWSRQEKYVRELCSKRPS